MILVTNKHGDPDLPHTHTQSDDFSFRSLIDLTMAMLSLLPAELTPVLVSSYCEKRDHCEFSPPKLIENFYPFFLYMFELIWIRRAILRGECMCVYVNVCVCTVI